MIGLKVSALVGLLGLAALLVFAGGNVPLDLSLRSAADEADEPATARAPGAAAEARFVAVPTPEDRERGLAELRRGLERLEAGDVRGAISAYEAGAAILPPFAEWAAVLAAEAAASVGDVTEVGRRLERIGPGAAAEWGWRVHVRALVEAGDSTGAANAAAAAAGRAELASERAAAWSRAGMLRLTRNPAEALGAFREAMRAGPGSAGGLEAARAAHDLSGLTTDDRLLVGRTLLTHGGLDRGVPMVEAWVRAGGGTPAERAAVQLDLGRQLFNARRYEPAERNLRAASASLPDAGFLLARTLYRQGRHDQGVEAFQAVARRDPASEAAANALFLLGDLAQDAGRLQNAREYYRQTIGTGVHNVSASDAAVRLAGMAILAGDAHIARSDLEAYLSARPRDRVAAPAIYWLGRAHLLLGDQEAARAHFREVLELDPFTYYGMLAAERLGTTLAVVELPEPLRVSEELRLELDLAFFRIDLLRDLDLGDASEFEIARLREAKDENAPALYHVAEGMSERGQPIAGALVGRRIHALRGEWDERMLRIVYQFPYRDLVVREARRNGLDPFVVAGLIRQESFFNPVAVSPAGAIGLMQVMPQTATGLARRAGISNFRPAMLHDPEINARLGTLYLADQMRRWDGRKTDVFAAYNAGPNRVVRWRQFPEARDEDIYVERIPIAETRDYVKRLRLNAQIYRRLYSEEL
jgi:soluble lytic murein transglycosylase